MELPTAVTIALALPSGMNVPLYIIFARSASGIFSSAIFNLAFLFAGMLSPVSADSSTDKAVLSSNRQSAAILSPAESNKMSPAAMFYFSRIIVFPFLITRTVMLPLIFESASKDLALSARS